MRTEFKVLPFRYPSDHDLAGQQDYFRLAVDAPPKRWPWVVAILVIVLVGAAVVVYSVG